MSHVNREREQALIEALGFETKRSSSRHGSAWIAFLLGVIATWFTMGVLPYWRLIVQIWQGCMS